MKVGSAKTSSIKSGLCQRNLQDQHLDLESDYVIEQNSQVGSFAGFGIIVICQTMEVFIFPDIFTDVPMKMYAAVTLLPVLGISLGYVAAFAFKLRPTIRRTVAIECGIQNVGTALAIVSLSYPYHVSDNISGIFRLYLMRDTLYYIPRSMSIRRRGRICPKERMLKDIQRDIILITDH